MDKHSKPQVTITSLVPCEVEIHGVDGEIQSIHVKFYIDRAEEMAKLKLDDIAQGDKMEKLLKRALVYVAPLSVIKLDKENLPVLNDDGEVVEFEELKGKAAIAHCWNDKAIRGCLFRAYMEVQRVLMEKNLYGLLSDSTAAPSENPSDATNPMEAQSVEVLVA